MLWLVYFPWDLLVKFPVANHILWKETYFLIPYFDYFALNFSKAKKGLTLFPRIHLICYFAKNHKIHCQGNL